MSPSTGSASAAVSRAWVAKPRRWSWVATELMRVVIGGLSNRYDRTIRTCVRLVKYDCPMAQISHREDLIEGAIKCLRTKGYARTTARDIAAASGAGLASIGYHFGSKDALLAKALL